MSDDTTSTPSLFGSIVTIAWIGEHPGDGGDFAMLMAYSPGDGELGPGATQPALRDIIRTWGMRENSMVESPSINGAPVLALLDGITVSISGLPGIEMGRPTSPEWVAIARRRGHVFFSITTRTWPEGPSAGERETHRFIEDDRTIRSAACMLLPVAS